MHQNSHPTSNFLPTYGNTADGHLAAMTGDLAYIAIPTTSGIRIASGWRLTKPISQWTTDDVYGSDGIVPDESGFRAHIHKIAIHLSQKAALQRRQTNPKISTYWGASQGATIYAEGIVSYTTASHGGFHLADDINSSVHPSMRIDNGWYEEDGDWSRVAVSFPHLFTDLENEQAETYLKNWEPDAWETFKGVSLSPEESFMRERQQFERDHAQDWIVISALRSEQHPGFTETVATIGGKRGVQTERRYLVPSADYTAGKHGFVIDQTTHQQLYA